MEELKKFLQNQRILQIAPHAGDPWIANVYMCCENPNKIYFIGSYKTLYGRELLQDPRLAFATAWHNPDNNLDRKGVQGVGEAALTKDAKEITAAVKLHNQNYPELAKRITVDWVKTNKRGSGVWVVHPTFIKFWNDELYGTDGSEEFELE